MKQRDFNSPVDTPAAAVDTASPTAVSALADEVIE
jgi:hypothetical protein